MKKSIVYIYKNAMAIAIVVKPHNHQKEHN